MKRVHVWITGKVQGVFFRAETQRTAQSLNLAGWVRNLPDRRVEAVFEGENAAIDKMTAWCKTGPPTAHVEDVAAVDEPYTGEFRNFNIRY